MKRGQCPDALDLIISSFHLCGAHSAACTGEEFTLVASPYDGFRHKGTHESYEYVLQFTHQSLCLGDIPMTFALLFLLYSNTLLSLLTHGESSDITPMSKIYQLWQL